MERALNIRSEEDFDALDLAIDEVENDPASVHVDLEVFKPRSVCALRRRRGVERRAEAVAAPASLNDRQLFDL